MEGERDGGMDGLMEKCVVEWMQGWMDGWTDGWKETDLGDPAVRAVVCISIWRVESVLPYGLPAYDTKAQ